MLRVMRSLERQFREEEALKEAAEEKQAVVEEEDDVPLTRRNAKKGKRPIESPPAISQSKRPKRVVAAKKA